jgi:hypothetical protein
MSATASTVSPSRPKRLALGNGGRRLRPGRQAPQQAIGCKLDQPEANRLNAFIQAVYKRTGRRITRQPVVASAIEEYLNRNRAWLDAP